MFPRKDFGWNLPRASIVGHMGLDGQKMGDVPHTLLCGGKEVSVPGMKVDLVATNSQDRGVVVTHTLWCGRG